MPSGFLGRGIGPRAIASSGKNRLLTGLVAYWPLNEAAGANDALDLHSSGLTLTQNGDPGSEAGKVYAGARAFATGDYFARASEAALQCGDVDFAFAAWVYATSFSTRAILGKQDAENTQEYLLYTFGGSTLYWQIGNSGSETGNKNVFVVLSSGWNLVLCTHDTVANAITIQINNGAVQSTSRAAVRPAVTAAPFTIGRRATGDLNWAGRIGPVAFWKGRVLDDAARAALWNGGAGLAYAAYTA